MCTCLHTGRVEVLEASTASVEWAETCDAVHVEFYVDQTWSAKEPFFTQIGQGETRTAAFAAAVGATRLRFSMVRCSLMFLIRYAYLYLMMLLDTTPAASFII